MDRMKGDKWLDVLADRRTSSDALWMAFHDCSVEQYKFSKNRNPLTIRNAVFSDAKIKEMVSKDVRLKREVERILDEMCHTFSMKSFRFTGFLIVKVLKPIYKSVLVRDHLDMSFSPYYSALCNQSSLKECINTIAGQSPIVYMPTHRSYADFVLFALICFSFNLPLPGVVAGLDFLQLSVIASLLRACGSSFIRRSFRDDPLYQEVFRSYVQTQVTGGERPLEFFIEGTRSRSGKPLNPKIGMLKIVVDLFFQGKIPDLVIIPVSISYDKTLEDELYAKELISPKVFNSSDTGSKPKETAENLFSGARAILAKRFGSIYVNFGKPTSLREVTTSSDSGDLRQQLKSPEQVNEFAKTLSKQIVCEQVSNSVVSPFALFCFMVLSRAIQPESKADCDHGSATYSLNQVISQVKFLCLLVPSENASHEILSQSVEEYLEKSFAIHDNLVLFDGADSVTIYLDPLSLVMLRHYANQAMQLLINVSILCIAEDYATFCSIRELLSHEFIYDMNHVHDMFNIALNKKKHLTVENISMFEAHILFYLEAYLCIARWLGTLSGNHKVKELVKLAQVDLEFSADIIENALHVFITRGGLVRNSSNLVSERLGIESICKEIENLIAQTQAIPRVMKSKL
ncbi:Dihydroxyacetone phosphate acyltransferase [Halotydeus destructor]|nr:Dihydroxyacetone phosphate acyltransferase [Halotydeus destructor]